MNLRIRPVLFGALAMLIATIGSRADTIVYNSFGPAMTITPLPNIPGGYFVGIPGTAQFFGAPFSPSATVDLTSLTGSWAAGLNAMDSIAPFTHPAPITISIWSGSSTGELSTELESWALTVDQLSTNYTLTSTTSPELVAGDTYWVLAGYTGAEGGENFMDWGVNTATTSLGLWELAGATNLDLLTSDSPALEVQGTPTTVPEPSTFLLTGIGFMSILLRSRWRRSSLR
jgi:hypothetical protein